ncbi:glycosyltransferase [Flavimarina sp. Hel_I_48]|uniref:glycosyltransferase family protein n=1 Tax=Flavimarina sp. Hel_I_48 TaxID=1392488 RepID=UPI0004DF5148|nr:glycosyltransferase [Flavimarina sp. Hel_I_48]
MRILLVGEYSNLHNSLKEGLQKNGHEVILLGSGDAFKKFPVDINVRGKYVEDLFLPNAFRQLLFRFFKFDIAYLETYLRVRYSLQKLGQFDVIQLINEYPFKTPYFLERKLVTILRKMTSKLVILGCGDDYLYLKNRQKLPYHPMDALRGKQNFPWSERYLTKKHKHFHQWIFEQKDLLITTDLDYHTIYKEENLPDYFGLIPNPVNLDKLGTVPFPEINGKIIIFHGINRSNYYKKGNDLFDAALQKIQAEFGEKVEMITAESLPYEEYIMKYDSAHIVLDQAYALDQGYNALEAMAKGKVVFTGAGTEFCTYYNIPINSVAIHTIPTVENITENLKKMLKNPEKLIKISENAKRFITENHDYVKVAQDYVKAWESIKI